MHCIHYKVLRDTENIFSMNFDPNAFGFGVTLSVKKLNWCHMKCQFWTVKAAHYDLSQNFGSLGGWVISILTLQMI